MFMLPIRTLFMGAAGRDCHNFNVVFRYNPAYEVVAFTAAQIPHIEGRTYPPELAGPRYPAGILIFPETVLARLISEERVEQVVFAYSDVSHDEVMHKASLVLAAGADFCLLGPRHTQFKSSRMVVSVCAVRTGAGKRQTARRVARDLRQLGFRVVGGKPLLRVLAGIEWCLEQQVQVLSMSLGFRGYTPFLLAIVRRLRQQGVLPVFAIGNEGPGTSRSPGKYAETLAVGALDENDQVASFSSSITFNRTLKPNEPDLVAPGVNVISAKPGGGVQAMDGTSMATPHVAGVAALLLQAVPTATVEQLEQALVGTCDVLPGVPALRQGPDWPTRPGLCKP
jgi:hypothetical protein